LFNKPSVYFIMGTQNASGKNPLSVLEEALKGGISHFQLREKGAGALQGQNLLEFAEKCRDLCAVYEVPFLINDDVELALAVGADGIHIGQEDMDCGQARTLDRKSTRLNSSHPSRARMPSSASKKKPKSDGASLLDSQIVSIIV